MVQEKFDYDVAIVGAGPADLMSALQLGQEGMRVCLLEKRTEPFTTPRAIAYDAELMRACALPMFWTGSRPFAMP